MIRPSRPADFHRVGHHYDELDPFYRALWGEHLHHGLWRTGRERPRDAALALVDEVLRLAGVGPGQAVCDVGCGYGATTRLLGERGLAATGLTVSAAQHARAVAGGGPGGPRFLLRDWLDNGLPGEAFDAVLAIECLAHMADKPAALAEAFRVLRPGGRLVACLWLAGEAPADREVRHLLRPICEEGRLPGLPTAAEYRRWAGAAGFRSVVVRDESDRVARTWRVCARRVAGALFRPSSWRYLLDGGNTERRFALSVLRILLAYRTGAMRYGILRAVKPGRAVS
ncbi:MAG: methyltransferase domain-containing protein [Gemmatimonadetes bacterium]|nr:methyltransferase domain-containing protein [Gemmatimonadota bacterium]NIQ52344.1 methyltransferase domain-containing protein [Gemmatimonadota bacterium]NIU72455.1 methyltransferase domain-containing protein [Gammaproteobacteria bacterium]NIX42912.1 methyltransferase domain-containing protein [Gemmatimonadota bacterium]NIY07799.1 methyltransferase domain-containing protein [Gemmatimonadota bacterium]